MGKISEKEIEMLFGKSLWDMTVAEVIENGLAEEWVRLVDENAK